MACSSASTAQHAACTPEQAVRIEANVSGLRDWKGVFSAYNEYGACNDDNVVEVWTSYSGVVASLLANRWTELGQLSSLADRHPGFRAFVLRHLRDETIPEDTLAAIRGNAKKHCPADKERLCNDLVRATR